MVDTRKDVYCVCLLHSSHTDTQMALGIPVPDEKPLINDSLPTKTRYRMRFSTAKQVLNRRTRVGQNAVTAY